MGRHVAGDMPELDRLVDEACVGIGAEIDALRVPLLAGVVLGGGYGRGEGGIVTRTFTLSNDLDFFTITEDGVPEAKTVANIAAALEPVSRKWTEKLGVDVDFAVKTPWRLKHDESRLMVQELVHGYFDVAGRKGEGLFAGIERLEPSQLPIGEATRLLMNRGMGLLLAKEKAAAGGAAASGRSDDFINRNINKCVLGAGDAKLIARGEYCWKAEDRAAALGDPLYAAAVEWKFRPKAAPVCDWEKAREIWLAAEEEVSRDSRSARSSSASSQSSRTLRNALRWLVRRRTIGDFSTFGLEPEIRVLRQISAEISGHGGISKALRRDWEVFN